MPTNARKAFFDAFANFKAEMPPVKKASTISISSLGTQALGLLLDTYNPILGAMDFPYSFLRQSRVIPQ